MPVGKVSRTLVLLLLLLLLLPPRYDIVVWIDRDGMRGLERPTLAGSNL